MTTTQPPAPLECWWWPRAYQPSLPTVLFFPGAGANHAGEQHLVPHLAGVNFGVWRMPGRWTRSAEPHPDNLLRLATECAESVIGLGCRRPVLAGKSFGGLLGYAVCQVLEARNFEVGRFIPVVSGHPSLWGMDAIYGKARGHSLKEHATWRLANDEQRGAWPPRKIADEAILEQARLFVVTDLSLGLQSIPHHRIKTPTTEVSAKDDEVLPKFAAPRRWAPYTRGEFTSILVTGGHYFYWANPQALATILTNEAEFAFSGSFS
ncbi:thioesterase II family protein [Mycobacteroides franklinii]|uniref:thioesterase II family protein n=1 Tax=Mycobacteroides franklinii TaxID=948102 RepID=UPI00099320D1|nr:thioesterase domain-containing protein [Mycobacteroides franklinii]